MSWIRAGTTSGTCSPSFAELDESELANAVSKSLLITLARAGLRSPEVSPSSSVASVLHARRIALAGCQAAS